MEPENSKSTDRGIIPPDLAVKAMRDGGYKNTTYALAELIDNSVQANARNVELICHEEYETKNERSVRRIKTIGVLDNGIGMDPETLWLALQFGNGTHLNDRKGIGRFGMGLPNSSISQCRRVDVWTWQSGPDNAMWSYLDLDDIENRTMTSVPTPEKKDLPSEFKNISKIIGTSGTLVLWSKFDEFRLTWRGADATLKNTEFLVGRLYRKFIVDGSLAIRLLAVTEGECRHDETVRVNDPLYLTSESSTPSPFSNSPMFQKWGEDDERIELNYGGSVGEVVIRVSWAREETLTEDSSERGSKPYGKHAANNVGVSIVREGRELELDPSWANSYDPVERWWGVEVEFPATLDEVFGVTNNKQNATVFAQMAKFNWKDEADEGESLSEYKNRIQDEGDPRALLIPIADHIQNQLKEVRQKLKKQTEGRRTRTGTSTKPGVDDLATTKFRERAESGHEISSDAVEPTQQDFEEIKDNLVNDKDYTEKDANNIAEAIVKRKQKVKFLTKAMEGYGFFNVEHLQGGVTAIVFNVKHPFYKPLITSLEPEPGEATEAELRSRIQNAADALELLFAAWARYELEEVSQDEKFFEIRQEWGKMARFFLTDSEDDS